MIFLIKIIFSFQIQAQNQINSDSSITITLKDYKQIYYDYKICDSIITDFSIYIDNTNKINFKKDSIIDYQELKIISYEREITFKDSTLKNTNLMLTDALKLQNKTTIKRCTSFIGGFLLAVLTLLALK